MNTLYKPHKSGLVKADINVVPLVDISLVLLIIFMITATFINTSSMNINLPTASAHQTMPPHDLTIEVSKSGAITLNNIPVTDTDLATRLANIGKTSGTESQITIKGDKDVSYGTVVHIMSISNEAGFTHLLVATKTE